MQFMLTASNILLLRNRGVAESTEMMIQKKGKGVSSKANLIDTRGPTDREKKQARKFHSSKH